MSVIRKHKKKNTQTFVIVCVSVCDRLHLRTPLATLKIFLIFSGFTFHIFMILFFNIFMIFLCTGFFFFLFFSYFNDFVLCVGDVGDKTPPQRAWLDNRENKNIFYFFLDFYFILNCFFLNIFPIFRGQVIDSTSARLTWQPVPPSSVNGHLKGYKVQTWTEEETETNARVIIVENNDQTNAVIDAFVPYRSVSCCNFYRLFTDQLTLHN